MNINLIPLYSFLSKKDEALIKEDLLFVDEINNYLMNDDLLILENAKDAIFNIVLIGSGGTENLFLKRLNELPEPLVILSTSRNNSLPASLEYLGYHAIKMNVSGGSVVVNYAGTKAQFQALASASASAYTGGGTYCFFTANNNNTCTVTCSDGTLTCRQNGTIS